MKFLDWMHQKMRKNRIDPLKDVSNGNYCTSLSGLHDEQQSYADQNFGSTNDSRFIKQPKEEYGAAFKQEPPTEIPELFHGFLTIGTLGTNEPPTPTFAVSSDDITVKTTEVTADELKLINDKLEKFLEADSEEGGNVASRNSCVRMITLCSKQEADQSKGYENTVVCPLQGYLFGSSVQLPETRTEKKNTEASLTESFQEIKEAHAYETYLEKSESMYVKRKLTSSKNLMKKILKKLGASFGSHDASFGGEVTNAVLAKKRFLKVPQMFYRKIHSKNSIATKERNASQGYKYNIMDEYRNSYGDSISQNDERNFSQGIQSEGRINTVEFSYPKPAGNSLDKTKGYWIKTDADYLVLELQ